MPFTLAHLSDIHLSPLPPAHVLDLCSKRITGYLNWQRKRRFVHDPAVLGSIVADLKTQRPDHIAVTGDIANIGLEAEYAAGRGFLDALGKPEQVSFVPGNHDIYVAECARFAARAWGPFMTGDDGETFPYVRRRGPLAIIGLSTGVPTAPFQATGELGDGQLGALATLLDRMRDEKLFRVVLIHHPPVSDAPAYKRLTDAGNFMHVIARHGAELILHGHDHRDMLNVIDGPNGARVPAVGVPSASAAPGLDKDNAGYHLYRIDGAPGAWRCEMVVRAVSEDGLVTEVKREML
ncbi:metallophosphoesterase [Pseudolabrys sp. FHR47]|uniref:metallophosphoesterase family protein n=1 Tax=Pseudolabrys sp. FHR47 TaxID=2562284 RepID=UPI0010BE7C74|nr:metallophosphoesterase [Pseudolabrys sp. FHR47]